MSEIVKCKHCGSPATLSEELIHGTVSHVIRCSNSKCGCALGRRTPEDVIARWNKHHTSKTPSGMRIIQ